MKCRACYPGTLKGCGSTAGEAQESRNDFTGAAPERQSPDGPLRLVRPEAFSAP
jgi:hypothetical protein